MFHDVKLKRKVIKSKLYYAAPLCGVARIIVPAPCFVNNSSKQAFGSRPSRMTAARTPPFKALKAVS
ncbi:MAG: hypothetical protein ACPHI0_08155, partial [Paracoccaceae bacterium]